jgi:hypothetical protein
MSTTTVTTTETTVLVELSNVGIQGNPGANNDPVYVTVRNATGATLTKGSIVYTSGGNGTHTQVTKALATGDATSARTLGWLSDDIANNATGLCMVEGYLDGINTQGVVEGSQLYLSGTVAGAYQTTKPQAPIHLVYVGVCVKASAGNGRVYVKVQNGYELDEIHDVQIISPTNNQVLTYDSATSLWKNATNTPDGVTSLIASSPLTGGTVTSTGTIGLNQSLLSLTRSQISDFSSGTVTSASTAQQAGTAVYATTSGTAVYATLSGTAVSISGSITKSQVSDFTSGTVANISGTVTQSQVTSLVSDLANRAILNAANSFTVGGHIVTSQSDTVMPLTLRRASPTATASILEFQTSTGTAIASVDASGFGNFPRVSAGSASNLGFATLSILSVSAGTVGAVIRGAASQSANLQQWQNSGATALASVDASGFGNFTRVTAGGATDLGYGIASINTVSPTNKGIVARSVANQTASLMEYQTSAATIIGGRNAVGQAWTGSTSPIFSATGGTVQSIATGANPLVTTASAHSLTVGDLVTLASTTGGVYDGTFNVATVPTSTTYTITTALTTGQASPAGFTFLPAQKSITARSLNTRGLIVKGATSQSANLAEFRNSADSILARVDSSGVYRGVQYNTNNFYSIIGEENSGGYIVLTKSTATGTAPATDRARLYLRDGTTGGTLKLVIKAGAAGAETTILDNIPQ